MWNDYLTQGEEERAMIMCGYNEHILGGRDRCWKVGKERIRSFRLNDHAGEDSKEIVQTRKTGEW